MAKIYLPPMEGFHDPFEGVQFGPGAIVEIIPFRGYGYRHVPGGLVLYRKWWMRLHHWLVDRAEVGLFITVLLMLAYALCSITVGLSLMLV